jgi:hypothetical protein
MLEKVEVGDDGRRGGNDVKDDEHQRMEVALRRHGLASTREASKNYYNMHLDGTTDSRDFLPCGPCGAANGTAGELDDCVLQLRGGGDSSEGNVPAEVVVIVKNARSLQTEGRFEELLLECETLRWDAILVNETWRSAAEEIIKLESGHYWFGSGGTEGKHGVGILLRKGFTLQKFVAISPRLCYLEVDGMRQKFSIIAAYMPHCGYHEDEVEAMYTKISRLLQEARSKKRLILLGGDWNAEVQATQPARSGSTVGAYANPVGNARGEWMASWASKEDMIIANTMFQNGGGAYGLMYKMGGSDKSTICYWRRKDLEQSKTPKQRNSYILGRIIVQFVQLWMLGQQR